MAATAAIERSVEAAIHALLLDPLCAAVCTPAQIRDMTLELTDAASTRICPGIGYWVRSPRQSEHDGPIRIDPGTLRGIDYGAVLVSHAIELENRTEGGLRVRVHLPKAKEA